MKKFALAILLALLLAATFAAFYRHQTEPAPRLESSDPARPPAFGLTLSTRLSAPGERVLAPTQTVADEAHADRWLLLSMGFLGAATLLGAGAGWLLRRPGPRLVSDAETANRVAANDDVLAAARAEFADSSAVARDQIETLRATHETLRCEFEATRRRLLDGENKIGELRTELLHAEQGSGRDAETLAEKQALIDSLHSELERVETHRRRAEEDAKQFRLRLDELDATMQERDETIDALEQEIAGWQAQLEESRESQSGATRQLADTNETLEETREKAKLLESDLARRSEQIEILEDHLRERDRRVDELGGKLSQTDSRSEELESSLSAAHERIETVEADLSSAREHIESLQSVLDQERSSGHELQSGLADRDAQIHALDERLGETVLEAQELAGYRDKLSAWHSTVVTFERDLRDRDARIRALSDQLAELDVLQENNQELRDALALNERQIADQASAQEALDRELANEFRAGEGLQEQIAELDAENLQLRESLDKQLHDGVRLRERVAQLNVEAYEAELAAARQADDLDALLAASGRDAREIRRLEDDVERWQDKLPPLESLNLSLSDSVASLRGDLDSMLLHDEQVREEAAELRRELDSRDSAASASEQRVAELTIDLETERETIVELNEQLREMAAAKMQLAEWRSTIDTFRGEVRHKTSQIDDLNDALDGLRDENRALREETTRITELEAELEKKIALAKTLKDGADSMRAFKAMAAQQAEELERRRGQIDEAHGAAEEAATALAAECSLSEALRAQLDEQDGRMQTLAQSLEDKELEVTGLEDKLALTRRDYSDLQNRADAAQRALGEIETGLAELDECSGSMAAVLTDVADEVAPGEVADTSQGDQGEDAHGAIGESITRLRSRLQVMDEAGAAAEELAANLAEERTANASLRTDLERARTALDDLRDQVEHQSRVAADLDEAIARNRALSEDLEELQARRQEAEARAQAERERYEELDKIAAEARERGDQLDAQLVSERGLGEQLASDIAALREQDSIAVERLAELRGVEADAQRLQENVKRLQRDIEERQQAVDAMLEEIGEITHQKVTPATWRQELAEIMRELGNKDARIDELAQTNVTLRDQIEVLSSDHRAQAKKLHEETAQLRAIISAREHALQELAATAAAAESAPEVPVLRDALSNTPPVLTTVVTPSVGENEDESSA